MIAQKRPEIKSDNHIKGTFVGNSGDVAYSRRSAKEVQAYGGRVIALGKFRESVSGNLSPRLVLILVEWESREAFEKYCHDPALKDLHPHRAKGTSNYIWQLFDKLSDLRPILKQ
jgi:uncharacterized protein (DUF1330 family)